MGGAPKASGRIGDGPCGAKAIDASASVIGKLTANRMSPAMVKNLASARKLVIVVAAARIPADLRKSRHARARGARMVYVARAHHDHALVVHLKHTFHHLILRRRNYM